MKSRPGRCFIRQDRSYRGRLTHAGMQDRVGPSVHVGGHLCSFHVGSNMSAHYGVMNEGSLTQTGVQERTLSHRKC